MIFYHGSDDINLRWNSKHRIKSSKIHRPNFVYTHEFYGNFTRYTVWQWQAPTINKEIGLYQ